jgi:N-succinyldiaminopimelate aminotransferase
MNKNLDFLTEYPFYFLRELLSTVENNPEETLGLHIGEPKNIPPKEALNLLNNHSDLYSKYPTSKGEYFLRESYCNWLKARFGIKSIDSDKNVLPISGSREGIFSFIQATIDTSKKNPTVIIPNPFYKIYEGAATMAGASTYYVNSLEENNFKPNFKDIPENIWKDCQLLILCSPSNPTGHCIDKDEYLYLLNLAEKYDFLVCSDECYTDIYESSQTSPPGLLESCDITENNSKAVVFHSLSKRSNLAGLRSGFITASESIINDLLLYRTYHGVTLSLPTQMASSWAWDDSSHVENNRRDYDKKYEIAISALQDVPKIMRPPGGFYIWLKVPCDDQLFAKKLYKESNVIVLPGSYLAVENEGVNPGKDFVRIAIVHKTEIIEQSLTAVNQTYEKV